MDREGIRKLKDGWGGPNSRAPLTLNLDKADEIADALADLGGWQYVPCEDGSVQLEIHENGWDVEIWISVV